MQERMAKTRPTAAKTAKLYKFSQRNEKKFDIYLSILCPMTITIVIHATKLGANFFALKSSSGRSGGLRI